MSKRNTAIVLTLAIIALAITGTASGNGNETLFILGTDANEAALKSASLADTITSELTVTIFTKNDTVPDSLNFSNYRAIFIESQNEVMMGRLDAYLTAAKENGSAVIGYNLSAANATVPVITDHPSTTVKTTVGKAATRINILHLPIKSQYIPLNMTNMIMTAREAVNRIEVAARAAITMCSTDLLATASCNALPKAITTRHPVRIVLPMGDHPRRNPSNPPKLADKPQSNKPAKRSGSIAETMRIKGVIIPNGKIMSLRIAAECRGCRPIDSTNTQATKAGVTVMMLT